MPKFTIVQDGDEAGIWEQDIQIVSWRELRRMNITFWEINTWGDKGVEKFCERIKKEENKVIK